MIFFDYSLSLSLSLIVWSLKDVYTSFQAIIGKIFTTNRIYSISTATKKGSLHVAEWKELKATKSLTVLFRSIWGLAKYYFYSCYS